jgi:hypothetical protein
MLIITFHCVGSLDDPVVLKNESGLSGLISIVRKPEKLKKREDS